MGKRADRLARLLAQTEAELRQVRETMADTIRLANGWRRRAESLERELTLERERDEPFLWDKKGSVAIVSRHAHVHQVVPVGGDHYIEQCVKNRWGERCPNREAEMA